MLILKFIWKSQEIERAKIILKKKNKVGGHPQPDLKICCKAAVIKSVWYWGKASNTALSGYIIQWKRTEIPEISPHVWPILRQV